jgi:hypothetical protein
MPTKKNIMEMLNQVSDSQPANDVMMSPSLDFDEALAATMSVDTPLAETLDDGVVDSGCGLCEVGTFNDDDAAVVDSGGDVQAVKGLL